MQDKHDILITSGILKGRKISVLSSSKTRSTKARVADSFFNSVREALKDATFIELFGGSGLMAMRAISEGASSACVIECVKQSYAVLDENIRQINKILQQLQKQAITAHFGDTFIITPQIIENNDNIILYADPPFDIREGFNDIYEKCIKLIQSQPKQKIILICIEHLSSAKMPQNIGNFELIKQKTFGKTTLSYYK